MIKNEKVIIRYVPDYRVYNVTHLLKGGMHRDGKKLLTVRKQNGAVMPYLPNGEPFLTKQEITALKAALGQDVDFGLASAFWKNNENLELVLLNGDVILDLSNVYDCLKFKIAQQYDMVIAPSWKDRDKLPTYKWAIVRLGEDADSNVNDLSFKMRAYMAFGKHENTRSYLTYLYYRLEDGKLISPSTPLKTVKGWFNDIIDKKVELFVKFVEDELLHEKALVFEAWQENIIHKEGDFFVYDNGERTHKLTSDGSGNIDDAAAFLAIDKNQQVKLEIEGKLNNKKSK